ncbi:MAG: hypothetical protein ACK5M7_00850 [Draconibacterium sp.]
MKIILGILLAFGFLVAFITWVSNKFSGKNKKAEPEEEPVQIASDCCGAHEVCEVEEMLQNPEQIIYFEDEELDRFQGVEADAYNDAQIDEFRDVLYTLKNDEIKMWLISIERRKLQLPGILRQEALMMVAEAS